MKKIKALNIFISLWILFSLGCNYPEIAHRDSYNLRVVKEIQEQFEKANAAIIFGAPGTGKTEQMDLALLGKKYSTFDLRNRFIKAYATENNTPNNEINTVRKKYTDLKEQEFDWLTKNKDSLIKEFIKNNENYLVFDEFDLTTGEMISGDFATRSALLIIQMAKEIREQDHSKKILFIIHENGLKSKDIADAMKTYFDLSPKSVIHTGHLSRAEQELLLSYSDLSENEKIQYIKDLQGTPVGYIPMMEKMAGKGNSLPFKELVQQTKDKIKKIYNVIKLIKPAIISDLKKLAQGQTIEGDSEDVLNSGLVGPDLVMSPLVRQVILE